MLLPMTGVGFRWQSLKRRECDDASVGGKYLICLFPCHSEVKPFLFFHAYSPHLLSLSSSPELTSPSHNSSKSGKRSCSIIHANILIITFIITVLILIVILFLVTLTAVSNLIGNLKKYQKLSASPQRGNLRLLALPSPCSLETCVTAA